MDEATRTMILNMVMWGDEDEVGEKLTHVKDLGAEGITFSLPGNGWDPDAVEQAGRVASKVFN
jgi:hypothetical protein